MSDFFGCYFPDHTQALNHTSCNAGAQNSWCCHIDDVCLSNGYCQQTSAPWSNRLGRHSCTDKTWSSTACPSYCNDVRPNADIGLYLAFDRPNGAFCCGVNVNTTTGQCQNATKNSFAPFDLPEGRVIWNRSSGAIIKAGSGTVTIADLDLPATSNTTSTAVTQSSSAAALASSSNSSTAVSSSSSSSSNSNSNIVPVAVGIAVPLAVLLIAALIALGFLFNQNRKLRKEKAEWAERSSSAPEVRPGETQYGRQSLMSSAPVYEYKQATSTNWEPYTPQAQMAQADYMRPPPHPMPSPPHQNAIEAGSVHIGELPATESRKPPANL
ncbi:hypothetical protein AMS68_006001 [Peltaster fructicola]|uniref:Mid2 domain-containing protein n=1 Tax=Peltaster fructicola TaxID=286661 RepID=A0A6H0Y0F1_9PEZI|nr:hypothetical protein AMS68_006001 [Peltaster fructicola]